MSNLTRLRPLTLAVRMVIGFGRNGGGTLGTIAAIALSVGCQNTAPEQRPDATMPTLKIMPLGDSITDGYNVPGGYRVPLSQSLRAQGYAIDFVGSQENGPPALLDRAHEGHSGWKIGQIHLRIAGWLAQTQPEIILLLIGTNDVAQGDRLTTAPARLAALLDDIYAQQPNTCIFVASIPPLADPSLDARAQAYNAAIPRLVEQQQAAHRAIAFANVYDALTLADLADGVHPNQSGHATIAAVWLDALLNADCPALSPAPP